MILYTIGHGTRTLEEFLELLRSHGVERLVDVRSYPGSRANPQFNKERLAIDLPAAGIAYAHARDLGGRRLGLADASPNRAWEHAAFRGYADYMMEPPFWNALDILLKSAQTVPTAIMCSETVWWRCHRRMIADAATARGAEARHIMKSRQAVPHQLTAFARVIGDRVSYEAGEQPDGKQ